MNNENLKGHGFHERTARERQELAILGGKASGEARRRKANFRKTLNLLLTAQIDSPEWAPMLEAMGLESTLESAVNAAIIKKALKGDVKAYEAIRDTLGQTTKSDEDLEEQRIKIERDRAARDAEVGNEDAVDEGIQSFLKAVRPSQEELDELFGEEEENDGEEKEE